MKLSSATLLMSLAFVGCDKSESRCEVDLADAHVVLDGSSTPALDAATTTQDAAVAVDATVVPDATLLADATIVDDATIHADAASTPDAGIVEDGSIATMDAATAEDAAAPDAHEEPDAGPPAITSVTLSTPACGYCATISTDGTVTCSDTDGRVWTYDNGTLGTSLSVDFDLDDTDDHAYVEGGDWRELFDVGTWHATGLALDETRGLIYYLWVDIDHIQTVLSKYSFDTSMTSEVDRFPGLGYGSWGLAYDSANLYMYSGTTIKSMAFGIETISTFDVTPVDMNGGGLAVAGDYLYFNNNTGISRVEIAEGATAEWVLGSSDWPTDTMLAADGTTAVGAPVMPMGFSVNVFEGIVFFVDQTDNVHAVPRYIDLTGKLQTLTDFFVEPNRAFIVRGNAMFSSGNRMDLLTLP